MVEVRKKQKQNKILEALDIIKAQDPDESMTQDTAEAWITVSSHPFFKDMLERIAQCEHVADRFNNHGHLNGDLVVKI